MAWNYNLYKLYLYNGYKLYGYIWHITSQTWIQVQMHISSCSLSAKTAMNLLTNRIKSFRIDVSGKLIFSIDAIKQTKIIQRIEMSKMRAFCRLNFRTDHLTVMSWPAKPSTIGGKPNPLKHIYDLYKTNCDRFGWWFSTQTNQVLLFSAKVRI